MTFDVLGTMRAIRDDKELGSTEALLLLCAVLRTDNATTKVRFSIEGLADDAKVSRKTAGRVFQQAQVLKYFKKVVRSKRQVDFWFADVNSPVGLSVPQSEWDTVTHSVGHSVQRVGHEVTPSTLSSTSTTNSAVAIAPAPTLQEDESKEEVVTESVESSSLPEKDGGIVERMLAERAAQKARLEAFLAEEDEVTPEQAYMRTLTRFDRDEFRRYRNQGLSLELAKEKVEQHRKELEEVW
jgi:hypothetical protein